MNKTLPNIDKVTETPIRKIKIKKKKPQKPQKPQKPTNIIHINKIIKKEEKVTLSKTDYDMYVNDMYSMKQTITVLLEKVNNLEDELREMKTIVQKKKQKIPLFDWLRENVNPPNTFKKWVLDIKLTESDMLYVCENNIMIGLNTILRKIFPLDNLDIHPIRAFKQKRSVFYIYAQNEEGNNEWKQMKIQELAWLIDIICMDLQQLYLDWREKNIKQIMSGDMYYENKDADYRMKLTSRPSNLILSEKIRPKLYNYLQYNLKDIIQLEFVF